MLNFLSQFPQKKIIFGLLVFGADAQRTAFSYKMLFP